MRIALFGGTFDPIHAGHLLMAEAAHEQFHLDQVVFLPSGRPPHKPIPKTSARHRLAMVRLAIRGNPAFKVSDWEVRQNRVVYTYETLDHVTSSRPRDRIFFIIGSDSAYHLPTWRQGLRLLDQCTFLTVERPGYPWNALPMALRRRLRRLECPSLPFASQDLRRLLRASRSIRYQVPDAVLRYIRSHRLYSRG